MDEKHYEALFVVAKKRLETIGYISIDLLDLNIEIEKTEEYSTKLELIAERDKLVKSIANLSELF